jgi:hypothetical protein
VVSIVVASSRRGDPARASEIWADAAMALNSVTLYAPEHEVVHAWRGPCAPAGLLPNPRLASLRQPETCDSYGEAFDWAVRQTRADELILLNDDTVLTPATIRDLLEDARLIRERHPEILLGFLACRSNFVAGPQNVRAPNGGTLRPNCNRYDSEDRVLAAERISPIAAYLPRAALDAIGGFPPLNWFSDDLMCWDLLRRGFTHFISRAYVHHIGQRTTTAGGVTESDLLAEARTWLARNRPDFLAVIDA